MRIKDYETLQKTAKDCKRLQKNIKKYKYYIYINYSVGIEKDCINI